MSVASTYKHIAEYLALGLIQVCGILIGEMWLGALTGHTPTTESVIHSQHFQESIVGELTLQSHILTVLKFCKNCFLEIFFILKQENRLSNGVLALL